MFSERLRESEFRDGLRVVVRCGWLHNATGTLRRADVWMVDWDHPDAIPTPASGYDLTEYEGMAMPNRYVSEDEAAAAAWRAERREHD